MKTVPSTLTSTCARLLILTLACLAAAGAARAGGMKTSRFLSLLLFLSLQAATLCAAQMTVTSLGDAIALDGAVTLREAIASANANAPSNADVVAVGAYGDDSIVFSPTVFAAPRKTITLGSELQIASAGTLAITAPPAGVEISGGDAVRVFRVAVGATATLTGLTIRDGNSPEGSGILNEGATLSLSHCTLRDNVAGDYGGGILNNSFANHSTVTVSHCTLSGNSAREGGGISNAGFVGRVTTVTISDSTLSGNSAHLGGGISLSGVGGLATVTISKSTLSGNSAGSSGAGIYNGIGGQLSVTNCTLSGNSSDTYGGGITSIGAPASAAIFSSTFSGNSALYGGALAAHNTTITIANTIFRTGPIGANLYHSGSGTFASQGSNLSDDAAGGDGTTGPDGFLNATGDRRNTDPHLGPLQNNGGPTATHALLVGSPAIDAGNSDQSTDQRGVSRPRGSADDIGAFELILLAIAPPSLATGAVGHAYAASLTITGGTPPYAVAVIAGSLPPGLTLDGSGPISGTPLAAGTFGFTVRATDSNSPMASGERAYSLLIGRVSAPLAEATAAWYRAEGPQGNADSFTGPAGTIGGLVYPAGGIVGTSFGFAGGANGGYVALAPGLFPVPTTGQTSTTPFSFETWFQTSEYGVILGQQNVAPYNTTSSHVPAIYIGLDGRLRVEMFWTGAVNPLSSAAAVNDGAPHHLAAVFTGAALIAYLDGVAIGTMPATQVGYAPSYFYQLGTGITSNWPSAPTGWFNYAGIIDETAIYDRALTAGEVQAIWGAGSKGKSTVPYISAISRSGIDIFLTLRHWPSLRFQIEFSPTLLPAAYQDFGSPFTGEADGTTGRAIPTATPTGFIRAYEVP